MSTVDRFALCSIVEGTLVRFLIRIGGSVESAESAREAIGLLRDHPRCTFWPDSVSYADVDLRHVRGHRQVIDAYLVELAAAHDGGVLATLDAGLARDVPASVVLVPS